MKRFKTYRIKVDNELNLTEYKEDFLSYIGQARINNLDEVIPPHDLMQLRNALFAIDPGSTGLSCFRIRTLKGTLNWIAANARKFDTSDPIEIELSDIQSLQTGSSSVNIDSMTGLYNKQAIIGYANELVQAYPRKNFYFFLMDIDHFKSVNDTFGHMKGDEVIIDVAHILRDSVGDAGVVGRIGGDEFMIVFENVCKEPELREYLRIIRDSVKEKYENLGDNISITVSLGGGLYPDYAQDYDSLFKLADKMLYIAKIKGRDRYIIYTPSVHGKVDDDIKVATVSHHAATENNKTRLILDLMDRFFSNTNAGKDAVLDFEDTINEALQQIMEAYDLDELYVIDENTGESILGFVRKTEEGKAWIEGASKDLSIILSDEMQSLFDINNMAIANVFDLKKNEHPNLLKSLDRNKCRVMAAYHMASLKQGGYIVFLNRIDSSCRLSETDMSNLTYFGHMLELKVLEHN